MKKSENKIEDKHQRYIAELEKAQRVILDSESRYRRLFENSQIPIWCDDFSDVLKELKVIRSKGVNLHLYLQDDPQRAFKIAKKIKVIDINSAALNLFKVQDIEQFNQLLIKSFEQGAITAFSKALCAIWDNNDSFSSDIKFVTSDGGVVDAIVTFRIPKTEDHFSSVPISIIDITERLQLQRENIRKTQLSTLGELSAKLAHEVNNPLSGVINYAEVLKNRAEHDGQDYELLDRIIEEGSRIEKILKGMLNFSYDSGEDRTYNDLEPIIKDVLMLTSQLINENNVDIIVDIPSGLQKIYSNSQQLQQVILNIVRNACQAISGGLLEGESKGIINISAAPVTIKGQAFVLLRIDNNGPNIPDELIDKIKLPFFTTKTAANGTGLGLCISNDIIQNHGGELLIESPLGKYTKMTIKLPAKLAAI